MVDTSSGTVTCPVDGDVGGGVGLVVLTFG